MKRSLRRAHGITWKMMAIIIPLILILAIFTRQDPESLEGPTLIEPPASTAPGVES